MTSKIEYLEGLSPYRLMLHEQKEAREQRRKQQRREQYRRWCQRNPDYQKNYQKQYRRKINESKRTGAFAEKFKTYAERLAILTPEQQAIFRASRAASARRYRAKNQDKMRQYMAQYQREYKKDPVNKEKSNHYSREQYRLIKENDPERYALILARARERVNKNREKKNTNKSEQK